jgi:CRISPR-associated protein Cas2
MEVNMPRVVVAYDVVANGRRRRLAKALLGFGVRVQKSVFEGEVPERRMGELLAACEKAIDPTEDSVRLYTLCERCRHATEDRGSCVEPEPAGDRVV